MKTLERRVLSRTGYKHQQYASVQEFLSADEPEKGVLTIEDERPIDIAYSPAGSDTTYILFNAAVSPNTKSLPVFSGRVATADGNPNRIFISDPAVSDQLRFGCYAGVKGMDLQAILPPILAKLIAAAGGKRTVFWGPSIGGFAALYYSRLFPESLAVAMNPQTDLRLTATAHKRAYAKYAHGMTNDEDYKHLFDSGMTSSLIDHYAGGVPNNILYIQNTGDYHARVHMEPFVASLPRDADIRILTEHWGTGHIAVPNDYLVRIASTLTGTPGPWSTVLRTAEFGSSVPSSTEDDAVRR